MQSLSRNLIAIIVAGFASTLAWIYGGTRGAYLTSFMPWMVAILAELMLCFPEREAGETQVDARKRLWRNLKRDPVVYVSLGLIGLLLLAFVNAGICISCDYPAVLEKVMPLGAENCLICHQSVHEGVHEACFIKAAMPFTNKLPSCLNLGQHWQVTSWFFAAITMLIAVRHALGKNGKRLVLELIMWNGLALAILGFIQIVCSAPGPLWEQLPNGAKAGDFFSTFGYPNMAGDYFTTLFAISIALWRTRLQTLTDAASRDDVSRFASTKQPRRLFWRVNYHMIPAALFYFSACVTRSRAAIILSTLLLVVFFIHSFISLTHNRSRLFRFRATIFSAVGLLVFFVVAFQAGMFSELSGINDIEICDRVSGRAQYHARVATEIWKDYPVFGCGGWGYKHLCISKMTNEELAHIQQIGGINVHNDYIQFLAEHGLAGAALMFAIVLLCFLEILKIWKKLYKSARFTSSRQAPPKPVAIFALPAGAFALIAALIATLIHALGDCPLRSPAVLTLFFIILAAIDGFLPKIANNEKESRHATRK